MQNLLTDRRGSLGETEVPLSTLCRLVDLTPRRVQQLVAEGVISKQARGRFHLVSTVRSYIAHLRARCARTDDGLAKERRRLVKARADVAEMDAATRAGQFIPAAFVEQAWGNIATEIRTRLMAVPSRVVPRITASSRPAEIGEMIAAEIDIALEALSNATIEEIPPISTASPTPNLKGKSQ